MSRNSRAKPASGISATIPAAPVRAQFSFLHYDLSRPEYCLSNGSSENIRKSMVALKEYSNKTWLEVIQQRTTLHWHEVDWATTKEPKGFQNTAIEDAATFQFSLIGVNGQKARVFGIFENPTFYIVWIDWNHQVQPSKLKGT